MHRRAEGETESAEGKDDVHCAKGNPHSAGGVLEVVLRQLAGLPSTISTRVRERERGSDERESVQRTTVPRGVKRRLRVTVVPRGVKRRFKG